MSRIKSLLLSATSKDAAASMAGNFSIALGGMLFTIVLARFLPPTQLGIFSALFAVATMFGSLSDLGISSALINFLPKFPADRRAIVSITFWFQTTFSLFLSLLILASLPFRQILLPGATASQVLLVSLAAFLISLETFAFSLQRAERKFVFNSLLASLDTWTKLIIIFVLGCFQLLDISTAITATIISVSAATFISLTTELTHLRPLFPKLQVSRLFHFTKWIAVGRFFSTATNRIDVVLLNALAGSYQAGIFAAASRLALVFAVVVSSLGAVIAPRFSAFTTLDQVKSYLKKISILTLIAVGGLLLTVISAPFLINLIFGSSYSDSIRVYQYLALAMIPFILTLVTINPLIYYFNQPSFVTYITIIQVVILIILDVLFIPHYGAIGPTYSLAISNLFVLSLSAYKLYSLLYAKPQ